MWVNTWYLKVDSVQGWWKYAKNTLMSSNFLKCIIWKIEYLNKEWISENFLASWEYVLYSDNWNYHVHVIPSPKLIHAATLRAVNLLSKVIHTEWYIYCFFWAFSFKWKKMVRADKNWLVSGKLACASNRNLKSSTI